MSIFEMEGMELPEMETWDEAEKRVQEFNNDYNEIIQEQESNCNHEGVDCETIVVCSNGCTCGCATEVMKQDEALRALEKDRRKRELKVVLDALVRRHGYDDASEGLADEFFKAAGLA